LDKKTLITFLLDRTGSMAQIKPATIKAFNGYLDGLRGEFEGTTDELIEFTFLQFDSIGLETICIAEPVGKVAYLTHATYQPRASTPLIDACVKTIRAVAKSLEDRHDDRKIVVCFQTDGLENCSTEHTWNELNRLITEKKKEGWQFNFLGVGIDAYHQAEKMGINPLATIASEPDLDALTNTFVASAMNARRYSRGLATDMSYSALQRRASRDPFAERRGLYSSALDLTRPTAPVNDAKGKK
jgi:hypothetical protein